MKDSFIKKFILSKSIRGSIIKSSIIVFIFIILALSFSLSYYVRQAYYNTIKDNLSSQIELASETYESKSEGSSLNTNLLLNLDDFLNVTTGEVQVLSLDGKVLMDTIGNIYEEFILTPDVREALLGSTGEFIYKVPYSKSKVMSVSYPIKNYNEVIGVLRFTVSLQYANQNIYKIIITFVLGALIALIFYIIIIGILTDKIVKPINTLRDIANKMALGDFSVRFSLDDENEIGDLGRTLNFMAGEISKKDELKNDFISTVSHELRTPLTSIKGWAITLQYDEKNESTLNGLKIIESETDRLSNMVEELLDFSKFISHKVTLKLRKVHISEISDYIKSYITPREDRENFKFIIRDLNLDLYLNIDFDRLKQVLVNVLDNSIKFLKHNGEIKVKYELIDDKIYIHIIDNGVGIPSDELPRVKEKFFKGKTSKSKNGLGLSISDEIMKLHGGNLYIDSEYGKFTCVTLELLVSK